MMLFELACEEALEEPIPEAGLIPAIVPGRGVFPLTAGSLSPVGPLDGPQ